MAVLTTTISNAAILQGDAEPGGLQVALLALSPIIGTYAGTDGCKIAAAGAAISAARRNGRQIKIIAAAPGHPGYVAHVANTARRYLGAMTVAISSDDVTFHIADSSPSNGIADFTTELADGAVPTQMRAPQLLICFTES